MKRSTHIKIGQIYREHGLNGFCKFYVYQGAEKNLSSNKDYLLEHPDGEIVSVKIKEIKPSGKYFCVHFDRFKGPEDVVPWRKSVLWIDKGQYQFDEDPGFNVDWIGFTVVDGSGKEMGCVKDVVYTPLKQFLIAGRIGDEDWLIPFVKEWILDVDREHQKVCIDVPEGLH